MYETLPLVKIGKTAVFLQLLIIPVTIVIVAVLGEPPHSALEAFEMMKENEILGLIRDDMYNILMISLYFFSFSGLFIVLRRHNFPLTFLATFLLLHHLE